MAKGKWLTSDELLEETPVIGDVWGEWSRVAGGYVVYRIRRPSAVRVDEFLGYASSEEWSTYTIACRVETIPDTGE